MSLLSTFRAPGDAGGRSWTRAEREHNPRRGWADRILGRYHHLDDAAAPEGFGDQRARALAAQTRVAQQTVAARPRPWR
jgi:hypothetical protein